MAQDPGRRHSEPVKRSGARIAFAVSSFHRELTTAMLESARRELRAAGLADGDLPVAWAPGAFELPLVARRLALDPRNDAVLCFGLVLKGETSHDQHVARAAIDGIQRVMLEADKPVLLGVLTCNTLEEARARALPLEVGADEGGAHRDGARQGGARQVGTGQVGTGQDKGREVARAALELLATLDALGGAARDARPPRTPAPEGSGTQP